MKKDQQSALQQSGTAKTAATKSATKRLGRGLGALMGDIRREERIATAPEHIGAQGAVILAADAQQPTTIQQNGLSMVALTLIEPHPDQPRRHFDEAALDELASSIAQRGVIQPVILRPVVDGRYQLVAGERRWRAAQRARLIEIPALIRDLDDREVTALALIENIQREDLNPIEEARAYQRLTSEEGLSQTEVARMVDKSRSHIANMQRLLSLPDEVITHVEIGRLSMGHARALVGLENAGELAEQVVSRNLSVRELERRVRQIRQGARETAPRRSARQARDQGESSDIQAVEAYLEEFLGLNVRIEANADARSGAVTIGYRTLDQLDLICQRLTGGEI